MWPGQSKAMLLTTLSFWFLPKTFSWFSGCLKKKGFLWKGKLKVNFSAFLSKLHCSWARTAFAYPRSYPFQNVDLHVTTLEVLSAVTWVCEAQGSCCVTRQVLVHQMPMFPFDISLIYFFWLKFASILSYLMSSLEFLQKSSKILK